MFIAHFTQIPAGTTHDVHTEALMCALVKRGRAPLHMHNLPRQRSMGPYCARRRCRRACSLVSAGNDAGEYRHRALAPELCRHRKPQVSAAQGFAIPTLTRHARAPTTYRRRSRSLARKLPANSGVPSLYGARRVLRNVGGASIGDWVSRNRRMTTRHAMKREALDTRVRSRLGETMARED